MRRTVWALIAICVAMCMVAGCFARPLTAGEVTEAASRKPQVWYLTNFYGHYIHQNLSAIAEASRKEGIGFVNDGLRLFKYKPQFRSDYGNSARLTDDGYSGAILAIPEQEDVKGLGYLREFIEAGGRVVVLFNAISAYYPQRVRAFREVFGVEFIPQQLSVISDATGVAFKGGQICPLWQGLSIGSKGWQEAGLDAYIVTEGPGWTDPVLFHADDGQDYCVSATRSVGKGKIMFVAAPNDCVGVEPSPGRLHETEEFFFPGHVAELDNLEAFMRLVRWAAAGTAAPTEAAPPPSHES
ncbi:MAG: hypothetical protein J7M08_00800 [Planctomycetes bacterium]|nr:hypothetical protein [Planctomycetota bacterium]